MNSLELAKQMLEEAGYKVTPPEDKFIPYKGQFVEVSDYGDKWFVREFSRFDDRFYFCVDNAAINENGVCGWRLCRQLSNPLIKQFKPWSERGDYNGPANVLFNDGKIYCHESLHQLWSIVPIAFEPLEK